MKISHIKSHCSRVVTLCHESRPFSPERKSLFIFLNLAFGKKNPPKKKYETLSYSRGWASATTCGTISHFILRRTDPKLHSVEMASIGSGSDPAFLSTSTSTPSGCRSSQELSASSPYSLHGTVAWILWSVFILHSYIRLALIRSIFLARCHSHCGIQRYYSLIHIRLPF